MATKLQLELKSLREQAEKIQTEQGDGVWAPEAVKSYQDILGKAEALRTQIDAQDKMKAVTDWMGQPDGLSAVKASWTREALPGEGDAAGITADPKTGELYAIKGVGAAKLAALKSGEYKDAFNSYLRDIGTGRAMKSDAMKVLNEGADQSGGFWVPPDYRAELVKKIATMTAIRQNAYAFTTGSDIATFPKVAYTTDDKYTAGTRFAWQASAPLASDISESTNPVAGRVQIPVHTASAAIFLTREQLEDNQFDLLGYISLILAETFALGEEDAFISGDGAGKPQGILMNPNAGITSGSNGGMLVYSGVAGKVSWEGASGSEDPTTGILGVEAELPPQYEQNASWYGNKKTYAAIRGLVDTNKRPLWALSDGGFQSWVRGLPATLLGYPINKTQFLPDIGAANTPLMFGDLGGYYIADRVGLSIEVLREIRALRGEVVIYARKRMGGQLVHDWRMKLLKSNNN